MADKQITSCTANGSEGWKAASGGVCYTIDEYEEDKAMRLARIQEGVINGKFNGKGSRKEERNSEGSPSEE